MDIYKRDSHFHNVSNECIIIFKRKYFLLQMHFANELKSKAPQLLRCSFFGIEFGILRWNFHVLFPVYFLI